MSRISSPESIPKRYKTLKYDICPTCNYCLVAQETFEEVYENEIWRKLMVEVQVIEKKN